MPAKPIGAARDGSAPLRRRASKPETSSDD
jgi:hypothetical protein